MLILVTGGAASGKSVFAEKLAARRPYPRYYLATMSPEGAAAQEKIERHRSLRAGRGFCVIERERDLSSLELPSDARTGTVLIEDLGNLVANELFSPEMRSCPTEEDAFFAAQRAADGVFHLAGQCAQLIAVTIESGLGAPAPSPETERYLQALGRAGCLVAARADEVHVCTAGIPVCIKGGTR